MPTATSAAIMEDAPNVSLGTISTQAIPALPSLHAQSATASNARTPMEPFVLPAIHISLFQVTAPLVRRLLPAPMEPPSTVLPVPVLMEPTVLDMPAHLAQATVFSAPQPLFALPALLATSSALELVLLVEATARLALMPLPARFAKADSRC